MSKFCEGFADCINFNYECDFCYSGSQYCEGIKTYILKKTVIKVKCWRSFLKIILKCIIFFKTWYVGSLEYVRELR